MIVKITNKTTSNVVESPADMTIASTACNQTRQFNCSLNPATQLDKIINDAHLPNFKLEVNNSGYNVNIRCNSGTYARVVKPTITAIDNGFTATANDHFCKFTRRPAGVDQNNLDFNDIINVSIHKCSSPAVMVANVTITAHHSSRNVQLQSCSMFGDITAPLWVTRHILLKTFENVAEKKKVEIEQFNSEVLALVNSSKPISSTCTACKKKFSAGSKPMQCSQCSAAFHTGCTTTKRRVTIFTCSSCTASLCESSSPLHSLAKRSRTDLTPETQIVSDQLSSIPDEPENENQRPRRTAVRRLPPATSASSTDSTSALTPSSTPVMTSATILPSVPAILSSHPLPSSDISIPSLSAPNPSSAAIPAIKPVNVKSKSTKKRSDIPTSPRSFQHEQTKVELDIVRTKLKQTETMLKDTNDMNTILSARNKLFEEKRVNDAHANLVNNPTIPQASQSFHPPKPDTVSPPPPTQPSPNTNPTVEALIQLELLKTLRASAQPLTQPQPCPPSPATPSPCSCSCSSQFQLLQECLQQVTNMLSLLNDQVLSINMKTSAPLISPVPSTLSSKPTADSSPSSPVMLPSNFDPTIPPPSSFPKFDPSIPPPQIKQAQRKALLPTPYPLVRPFLLPTPPFNLYHPQGPPNKLSHPYHRRKRAPRHYNQRNNRLNQPSTSASSNPTITTPTPKTTAFSDIIEDVFNSIFNNHPTTSTEAGPDDSTRTLDDPAVTNELGNPLN